ncbi:MAG: hypothetical protein KKF24_16020 [Gammaproteobacteria bacterium]|nr:hypothetical protein [Gammaproteobacteria bacterium]MBU1834193.1 hypothetical protein [Gammaproteobacteria bacterium]
MRTLITGLFLILAGCATTGQDNLSDFNTDFDQSIPTNPKYKVEPLGDDRYQIVVYQGNALLSERTTRAAFLTKAAMIASGKRCKDDNKTLGKSDLNYQPDSMGYMNLLGFFTCE